MGEMMKGETILGAPHARWANRAAVAALAIASLWAFASSFSRELARPPEGGRTDAKVVVMAAPPPASGLAPLRTYAVTTPQRPAGRIQARPPMLDVPSFAASSPAQGAPSAGAASKPASASAPATTSPQAQPTTAPY